MVVSRDLFYVKVSSLLEYFAIRASVLERAEEMNEVPARMIGFEAPKR